MAEVRDFDKIAKSIWDGEGEHAEGGSAVNVEFELAPVESDFLYDDIETERGGETPGGEIGHPGLVIVFVGEGGVAVPTKHNFSGSTIVPEMITFLVGCPTINVHGFCREMDEGFDAMGTVVAHTNGKVEKTDVIERMVRNGDFGLGRTVLPTIKAEGFSRDPGGQTLDVFVHLAMGYTTGLDIEGLLMVRAITTDLIRHGRTEVATLIAGGAEGACVWIVLTDSIPREGSSVRSDFDEGIMMFHELGECSSSDRLVRSRKLVGTGGRLLISGDDDHRAVGVLE